MRQPPWWIKSVLALLYHVLAVKYKTMWVVLVKITENLHILGSFWGLRPTYNFKTTSNVLLYIYNNEIHWFNHQFNQLTGLISPRKQIIKKLFFSHVSVNKGLIQHVAQRCYNYNITFRKLEIHTVKMRPNSACYTSGRGNSLFELRPLHYYCTSALKASILEN